MEKENVKALNFSFHFKNEADLDRVKEKATRLVELLKEAQGIIESLSYKGPFVFKREDNT